MKNNTNINIRLNEKDRNVLVTIARLNKISLSQLVRRLIDDYIKYISIADKWEGNNIGDMTLKEVK